MVVKAFIKVLIGLLVTVVFGFLAIHASILGHSHEDISNRLAERIRSLEIMDSSKTPIDLSISGRTVTLSGDAPSETTKSELVNSIAALSGVRRVDASNFSIKIITPNISPFVVSISRIDKALSIDGYFPTTDVQMRITQMLNERFPDFTIGDNASLATGVSSIEEWETALSVGIRALENTQGGVLQMIDDEIRLSGSVAAAAELRSIESLMRAAPDQFSSNLDIDVVEEIDNEARDEIRTALMEQQKQAQDLKNCALDVREDISKLEIRFESSRAILDENSIAQIQALSDRLAACPQISLIIRGHTDSSGPENENVWISALRARSVADVLFAEGIDQNRITAVGVGSSNPVADNSTLDGRAQNRRIEIEMAFSRIGD